MTPASFHPCVPRAETGPVDPVVIERYNTPGFVGCLSRVQFNGVAPLKSALRAVAQAKATPTDGQSDRQPAAALPVSYLGKLVESNCGASPLTIPPMSAATDPWHLDNTGEQNPKHSLPPNVPDFFHQDLCLISSEFHKAKRKRPLSQCSRTWKTIPSPILHSTRFHGNPSSNHCVILLTNKQTWRKAEPPWRRCWCLQSQIQNH